MMVCSNSHLSEVNKVILEALSGKGQCYFDLTDARSRHKCRSDLRLRTCEWNGFAKSVDWKARFRGIRKSWWIRYNEVH